MLRAPVQLGPGEGSNEAHASSLFAPFPLPLQSPCRPLLFPAHRWEKTGASSTWPRRPVHGKRWHVGVGPHVGTATHAISSFRTAKCLAKFKCSRDVGSHTERQGPGSEANCWLFPEGPAPFPVQCPHWGMCLGWPASEQARRRRGPAGRACGNPLLQSSGSGQGVEAQRGEWTSPRSHSPFVLQPGPAVSGSRLTLRVRCLETWPPPSGRRPSHSGSGRMGQTAPGGLERRPPDGSQPCSSSSPTLGPTSSLVTTRRIFL